MTRLKTIILLIAVCCQLTASAQKEETMVVHLKNGNTMAYQLGDIDYIDITQPDPSSQKEVDIIGGTVAEAVDMGVGVLWAEHNCGAYVPSDAGGYFSRQEAEDAASLWGAGWRLPTDAEWEELYSSCTWMWAINNGVCGRLVTSRKGRTIFIPAAGITMDDKVLINGNAGIYWSQGDGSAKQDQCTGAYFDSANIYRMGYPATNTMTVRLVRN